MNGKMTEQVEEKLTNNVVLKKISIALNLKQNEIREIIVSAGQEISKNSINAIFRGDLSRRQKCSDQVLSAFLDGLILKNRGERIEE